MIRYFLVLFAVAAVATVLLVTRVDSVTFALAMLAAGRAGRWVLDRPGSRCRGPPAHSRARRPPRPDGASHPPTTSPIPLTPAPSGNDGPLSGKASGFAASGARPSRRTAVTDHLMMARPTVEHTGNVWTVTVPTEMGTLAVIDMIRDEHLDLYHLQVSGELLDLNVDGLTAVVQMAFLALKETR